MSEDYRNVPPPASLTGPKENVSFSDALAKARAIAAKLSASARPPPPGRKATPIIDPGWIPWFLSLQSNFGRFIL